MYNDDELTPFYPNGLEDYVVDMDNPIAVKGATEFYYLLSGTENLDDKLPENKFLKRFKFVDDKYRLVEKGVTGMGICLGMQLLADYGYDGGIKSTGLHLFDGYVEILPNFKKVKIPNIGWRETKLKNKGR